MFGSPSSQSTRRRCLAPTSQRSGQPVSRCRPQRDFYPAVAQHPHLSVVSSIQMLPWRQELIFTWVFESVLCKADKSRIKKEHSERHFHSGRVQTPRPLLFCRRWLHSNNNNNNKKNSDNTKLFTTRKKIKNNAAHIFFALWFNRE